MNCGEKEKIGRSSERNPAAIVAVVFYIGGN